MIVLCLCCFNTPLQYSVQFTVTFQEVANTSILRGSKQNDKGLESGSCAEWLMALRTFILKRLFGKQNGCLQVFKVCHGAK